MRCPQRISPGHQENPLRTADNTVDLQPNGVLCVEAARRAVSRVPTRGPFAGVIIEWRGVEPQPGYDGERVTFTRIDCHPFACATFAVAAKLR